ncbi:MAG: hypothetical protein K8I27_12180 [Planctomycetes bacterium]|nr:hypothetical protein [Planctomycetota bacterium]
MPLALLGGVSIVVLLGLLAASRTRLTGVIGMAIIGGVEIALIKVMFDTSHLCPLCLMFGVGIGVGYVALLISFPRMRYLMWAILLASATASVFLMPFVVEPQRWDDPEQLPGAYKNAFVEAQDFCSDTRGVCVVVFERPGCAACNILKTDSDRKTLEGFAGSSVEITRLRASEEMVVPTVVIGHRGTWAVFRGAPTQSQLEAFLLEPGE